VRRNILVFDAEHAGGQLGERFGGGQEKPKEEKEHAHGGGMGGGMDDMM
jgi:hypothetical protein